MLFRLPVLAGPLVGIALAVSAPTAGAATWPVGIVPLTPVGACADATSGQGRGSGNSIHACVVGGLSFIGPSSNVSSVVGPTIVTPSFVGTSIVAGGNVAIGP